jgi:release factor glutamine methyltransferase
MQEAEKSIDIAVLKRILRAIGEPPNDVYRPSDDTFLMLEATSDFPFKGKVTLDLGTGSGMLGLFAAIQGAIVTVADVDKLAVKHTAEAAKSLGVKVKTTVSDLFSNIHGQFDVVLFNPPYLPSASTLDAAIDGGQKGMVLVERFLRGLTGHLKKDGTAFLLLSSLNDLSSLTSKHDKFSFTVAKRRAFFFEELQVLRLRLRDFSGRGSGTQN